MEKITEKRFAADVLEYSKEFPVVVDFSAVWCPPCAALKPILEELSKKNTEVKFFVVDVDDEPNLSSKYSVSSIPTIIFFKDGEESHRLVGLHSKKKLEKDILDLMTSPD